jgi:mannonate dehydratase
MPEPSASAAPGPRIAIVLTPPSDRHFRWAAQIGVTDFVARYPMVETLDRMDALRDRAGGFGLALSVVEGYLPIDAIVYGRAERDDQIGQVSTLIRNMGRLGVEVLCYNFMPFFDMIRTSFRAPERGGAISNSFDGSLMDPTPAEPSLTSEQLWAHLEYFLRRVVPVAEDAGVRLAMHPDDPPVPVLRGSEQIIGSVAAYERLVELVPSPANGICFCQGTFAEMGEEIPTAIRRLAPWIHYAHFRDVRGTAPVFQETFHDNGKTDMAAAMRTYFEVGFRGAMRPDHVPSMDGEEDEGRGYTMLGRLFAVGYMRGLMHAAAGAIPRSSGDEAPSR